MWRAPLMPPGGAAGDQNRQVHVVVDVGIAHAAAVEEQPVVEERAVAFGRRLQLLEEYANSDTWKALIFAIRAILSGSFPWCVSG